jgi:hypothetical protein
VAEVCERAGITPAELAHGFLGLPAYGEVSADLPALAAAARAALGHDRFACGTTASTSSAARDRSATENVKGSTSGSVVGASSSATRAPGTGSACGACSNSPR